MIKLMYNCYLQGLRDDYDSDYIYDGEDEIYTPDRKFEDYKEFREWFKKNEEDIEKLLTKKTYKDGFINDKEYQEYFYQKEEREKIEKEGIQAYLTDKYYNSPGIEKSAYSELVTNSKSFSLSGLWSNLKLFLNNKATPMIFNFNNYDIENFFIKRGLCIGKEISMENKTFDEIKKQLYKRAVGIKMREIIENIEELLQENEKGE